MSTALCTQVGRTYTLEVQPWSAKTGILNVGRKMSTAAAVSCDIAGFTGESPGNGLENNALSHGNSKCVCTFGIADLVAGYDVMLHYYVDDG